MTFKHGKLFEVRFLTLSPMHPPILACLYTLCYGFHIPRHCYHQNAWGGNGSNDLFLDAIKVKGHYMGVKIANLLVMLVNM